MEAPAEGAGSESVEGWFEKCFSCGMRTAETVDVAGFLIFRCRSCMRTFRQRAAEMRVVTAAACCAAGVTAAPPAGSAVGVARPRSPPLQLPPSPPLPPPRRLRRTVSALSLGSADTDGADCAVSALYTPAAAAVWCPAPAAAPAAPLPPPGGEPTPASSPSGDCRARRPPQAPASRPRRACQPAPPCMPPPLALPPAALSLTGAEQQAVLRGLVTKLRAMLMQTPEAEALKRSFREQMPAAAAAAGIL